MASQPVASPPLHPDAMLDMTETTSSHAYRRDQQPQRSSTHVASSASLDYVAEPRRRPQGSPPAVVALMTVMLIMMVLACVESITDSDWFWKLRGGPRGRPISFLPSLVWGAEATAVRYRGGLYRGITEEDFRRGGQTFSMELAIPAFPSNETLLREIMAESLTQLVRIVDQSGNVYNSMFVNMDGHMKEKLAENNISHHVLQWQSIIPELVERSDVEVGDGGRLATVTFAPSDWSLPPGLSLLVVPCLTFSIFGSAAEIELNDMPMNCLSGDPFLIRHEPMLQVVEDVWSRRGQLVTGRPIEVPIRFHAAVGSLDRLALERGLRVVEGTTCLHSRNAFVRGSMWDPRAMVYRFTPHRGGVQTLCFMPFPDTYPLVPMRIKLMDSYEVAGPEGASTDPPQVRVEQEFSGTIYGTNLTTRDTAVMTDELCTDFSSQNVFFVELFFSSPTRVSFYGKFHRRGIYHICYHHADADAYVRVTTLLVEKGREVTIDGGTSNVLIDQDVRLVESASVTRLKVQNKGHLDLKKRSLNVSFFLWSGGSITGKGVLNCTGYSRITTEGYETRLLSVPLHNYGDMTIDVQRLFIGRDGAIHNYGNLTLLVSSLGMDGISSAVSHGKRNVIHNHHGGTLRIMALDKRSYALLTCRLLFSGGRIVLIGPISLTDVTAEPKASIRVSTSAAITGYSMRLACPIQLEEGSSLTLMEGSALSVAEVFGTGELIIRGDGVMLDSLLVHDQVSVLVDGVQNNHSITVSVYGTCEFGEGTFVRVVSATFATSTGLAKMMFAGVVIASIGQTRFSGNMIIQASGVCVVYSAPLPGGAAADWVPTVASLFVPPRATLFAIDARFMNDGTSEAEAEAEAVASALAPAGQTALCSSFIALSEYLTLGGRLLLHGCVSIPLGGTFSGAVARMSDVDDSTWSTLQATCDHFLAHMEVPPYCSPSSRPPPAMRTGLSTGNELHIRQGASFTLDEFTLLSGVMRVVDRLSMNISGQASINGGTRLLIGDGGSIRAKKVIINGSVEIGTPSLTAIVAEEVELLEEGVVVLSRTSKSSCEEAVVAVFGSLDPLTAHPDAVHCLQSPDSAEADLRHHPADISDSSGKNLYIAMFHTGLACPTDVVDEMQSLGNILSAFFHTRSYYPIDSIPSRSGMLWFFFISVVASVAIFLLLLHAWKSSFRGWVREMQIRPPLHLTLTWDEFSYNIFNYVTFSSVVLVGVQNMVAVFHPGIPVPVPFAASFGLRSMHLVMPHHRMSKCHSYVVSFLVLAWGAATYTWFGTSEEAARRRGQLQRKGFLLTVLMAITNIVTILLSMLHVPIFSMLLDGVACRTILRDLPTCQKFRDDGIFALIFALISVVVCVLVVPWNMVVSQIPISRVELRIRGFWTFVIVAMEVLEVSLWKVFYSSPIPFVFSCVAFQLSLVGLCVWSAPTAYENINRFYTLSAMIPLMVYVWLLFYCYQAKMGHLSSCLDYDTSFKMVLCCVGLAYLANFWRNILSVRYSMESSGDVNIDSLKQSVEQIASRIQDLKVILFSANERTDRESTLNAIARLRLEYLEKQECYRFGTARLLREFNFGSHFSDLAQRAKASSPFSPYELPLRTDSSDVSAFSLENAHLLSSSFSQTSHGLLTVDEMETFKCGPTLGKGSYGTVHMGIISSNAMLVAVKYVNVANESKEYLTSVKAEVDTLRELSHPNIIRYYGAHTMDDTMMVFMEFAMGGSLTSIVRKFTALTEQVMQLYTYQILCGLQYLHGKGVVHRDIKGENILIDGNGIAKLADFGCSKSLANIANGSQVGCGTLVGSPFWMAPEVIRNEAYGTKADIWSVGCTVVEMLNGGEPPWREEFDNVYSAMYFVGSTTGIPPIPDDTSEPCRQFLHRCFERDVAKRATAEELLQHPWLAAVSVSSARVRTPDVDGISSSPSFRAAMGLSPVSSAADSLFGEGSLRRRYATNGSKESLTNHSGAPRSSGNHSTPPESAPASGSATTTAATAAASPTLRKDQ